MTKYVTYYEFIERCYAQLPDEVFDGLSLEQHRILMKKWDKWYTDWINKLFLEVIKDIKLEIDYHE